MPRPCDPGSPREPRARTNTLGPVLHGPGKQEARRGKEGKGHLGSWLCLFLRPGWLGWPEPPGEQTHSIELLLPDNPVSFAPLRDLCPLRTKGDPYAKNTDRPAPAQLGHPTPSFSEKGGAWPPSVPPAAKAATAHSKIKTRIQGFVGSGTRTEGSSAAVVCKEAGPGRGQSLCRLIVGGEEPRAGEDPTKLSC